MHYEASGYVVRSENAAKPASQASRYLIDVLQRFTPMRHALDYGCGKLRYAVHLAEMADAVTVVDSAVQLDRVQIVCGERTTVRDYVNEHWGHGRALSIEEFKDDRGSFDFALCANVLSAIPNRKRRRHAITLIAQHLRARGRCLFVCQYTNSYFCQQMASDEVRKHGDGFIKGTRSNASFYGLIRPAQLAKLVESSAMEVAEMWRHDQCGYVVARPS